MKMKSALFGLLSVLMSCGMLQAQWPTDGTPVCTNTEDQYSPVVASDGAGGAIIAWTDGRNGTTNYNIYAQRVDSSGFTQWTADGVVICNATGNQHSPTIMYDGAGGAIITWYDYRGGTYSDVYAQKINSTGIVQWTANGAVICTAAYNQSNPTIASDGSDGAIITWHDLRGGTYSDVYAQKINSSGTIQWAANGVVISAAANNQVRPVIVSDGSGGAVIVWDDKRGGTYYDVYAQKINSSGTVQWNANGTSVTTAADDQQNPDIVSDGAGGAIITWEDYRNGANLDVYAQRINSTGTAQWTANGTVICTTANNQRLPAISSDGAGGAIITWPDYRGGTYSDIFTQKIDSSGMIQWAANGVAICTAANNQGAPFIISDGLGGAIIAWTDGRNGTSNYNIYTQKIDASGSVQWTADGVAICTAANDQINNTIVSDGYSGAIIAWQDERGGNYDIYAHRVGADGTPGGVAETNDCKLQIANCEFGQSWPNPFSAWTSISYQLPATALVHLSVYNTAGQLVRNLIDGEKKAGRHRVVWNGKDEKGKQVPAGLYFCRLNTGSYVCARKMIVMK